MNTNPNQTPIPIYKSQFNSESSSVYYFVHLNNNNTGMHKQNTNYVL